MGIDQKLENILGKLSVLLPRMESYEGIVRENCERLSALTQRIESELRAVYVRLKTLEDAGTSETRKREDRSWNVLTILLSILLSAAIAYWARTP